MRESVFIKRVSLVNFRNHSIYRADTNAAQVIFLGANGRGKTSILEAISLLMPGKGFRAHNFSVISRKGSTNTDIDNNCIRQNVGWQALFTLDNSVLQCEFDIINNRKILKWDGEIKKSSDITSKLGVFWLVPEMDSIFISSTTDKRRFLDQMVYSFIPEHAINVLHYNHNLKSRQVLLKKGIKEDRWFKGIEIGLAESAVAIAVARLTFAFLMREFLVLEDHNLPSIAISVIGEIENHLLGDDSVMTNINERLLDNNFCSNSIKNLNHNQVYSKYIDWAVYKFANNRELDCLSGRSNFGTHRSEFIVKKIEGNEDSENCSSGEQKILLISLIVAQSKGLVKYVSGKKGKSLVLLLDDILAHLDEKRRDSILELLTSLPIQLFLTSASAAEAIKFRELMPFALVQEF